MHDAHSFLYRGADAALNADLGLLGTARNSCTDHEQRCRVDAARRA